VEIAAILEPYLVFSITFIVESGHVRLTVHSKMAGVGSYAEV
jgi:hypothetical protein